MHMQNREEKILRETSLFLNLMLSYNGSPMSRMNERGNFYLMLACMVYNLRSNLRPNGASVS